MGGGVAEARRAADALVVAWLLPQSMFGGAAAFNGDVSKWDVSSVTTMEVRRPRLRSAWVVRAGRRLGAKGWGGWAGRGGGTSCC